VLLFRAKTSEHAPRWETGIPPSTFAFLPSAYSSLGRLSPLCFCFFRNEGTKMMMMPVLPDGFGSGSFFFSAIFLFSYLLVAASGSGFFLGSVCVFFLLLGIFSGFSSQNPPWFRLLLSSSVLKILLCSGSFFVSSPVVFLFPVFFPLLFAGFPLLCSSSCSVRPPVPPLASALLCLL